jgi:hypothetical protein
METKTKRTLFDLSFFGLVVLAFSCFACLCLMVGCVSTTEGGAEWSIGMRNDNFLVLRHTVDGDKVDKKAAVGIDLRAPAWELVKDFFSDDEEDTDEKPEENPGTGGDS